MTIQALPTGTYGVLRGSLASAMVNTEDPSGPPVLFPASGTLTITPAVGQVALLLGADSITVPTTPTVIDLNDDGTFEVSLIATDNEQMTPQGWTYRVTFDLGDDQSLTAFSFMLPAGETTDISTVAPLEISNGTVITQGVTPLELSARITAEQARADALYARVSRDLDTNAAIISGS